MRPWLKRSRGALGMGLTWALGWGVAGVGLAMLWTLGVPLDGYFRVFDAPAPALALPGFVAGTFFSVVIGIAARHRRIAELSLPRFAGWGLVGGLMLTFFPNFLVLVGLATPNPGVDLWRVNAVIIGPFTVLSVLSAMVTLLLARRAEGGRERDAVACEGTVPSALEPGDPGIHDNRAATERQHSPVDSV